MTLSITDHPLHHSNGGTPDALGFGRSVVVLKLGGNVLINERACARAASEIHRHQRGGKRVVAVVSALWGATDALLSSADALDAPAASPARAELLATGEQASAVLLGLALSRSGIRHRVLRWHDTGITAAGSHLCAEPKHVDLGPVKAALEEAGVVVVPGFVAEHEDGGAALLGFGGSDHTALLLAGKLGAEALLMKDNDGVFDDEDRRYSAISWDDAPELAAGVVTPNALRFAKSRRIGFTVSTLNATHGTAIGGAETRLGLPARDVPGTRLRVAFLGSSDVRVMLHDRLSREPERFVVLDRYDPDASVDVLIDVTAGGAALAVIKGALAAGTSVVTANASALDGALGELHELAEANDAALFHSGAVGGTAPMLEFIEAVGAGVGDAVVSVRASVNGTANVALDALARGGSLETGVHAAQLSGLASRDLTPDLDGLNASRGLAVLAHAAFGGEISSGDIHRRGVQTVDPVHVADAHASGATVRLVATARRVRGGLELTVEPRQLHSGDPLALPGPDAFAAEIVLESGATRTLVSENRGSASIAEALLADLYDLSRSASTTHTSDSPPAGEAPQPVIADLAVVSRVACA